MSTTPAPTDHDALKAAVEAVEHLTSMMATNSRDWGAARDDAWFYGIAVGWGPDEDDPESEDALPLLAARHGWTPETQGRLRALRAGYASVPAVLAHERWLRENAGKVCDNAVAATHEIAEQRDAALSERDAARAELAKTQARVATLDERVTTWKTRLVEETATLREELAKTRAELAETLLLLRGAARAVHHRCELGYADIRRCEDADCNTWAHKLDDHGLLPEEWGPDWHKANPATTAEPADEPKADHDECDGTDHPGMTCDQYDTALEPTPPGQLVLAPLDAEPADEPKAKRRCAVENCDGTPLPADLVCDRHPACGECGGRAMHDLWCKTARARRLAGEPAVRP